ncbi:hypothetical protein ACQKP8_26445 [Photobacterium alginatilyticum]|uniref:hypothetical protein n=1 Tax=Photobacterium alginatilyticum TaxID=1775171 RepID=UPI0040688C93
MKVLQHIMVITFFMFLSGCISTEEILPHNSPIVGVWSGVDEGGVEGSFIFNSDGSADVIRDGISIKDAVVRNRGTLKYHYDPTTTPSEIVLIIRNNNNAKVTKIYGIVEFVSKDSIRINMLSLGKRPVDFSGGMVLNRTNT